MESTWHRMVLLIVVGGTVAAGCGGTATGQPGTTTERDTIVDDEARDDDSASDQGRATTSGGGGGTGAFYCFASGSVRKCSESNGFQNCHSELVTGGGRGTTEQAASASALSTCANNLTSAIAITNIGGSANIENLCTVDRCERQ